MNTIKEQKLVSIIVPVYNADQYLDECLESIIRQTYQNLEIILVDDFSVDHSKEIIRKYLNIDRRIILLEHEKNEGVAKSRNDGLFFAHGAYIGFVDADDKISNDFVKELVAGIGNCDICICGYTKFNTKRIEKFLLCQDQIDCYEKVMFHVLCSNYVGGYMCNKLFRKELICELNLNNDLSIGEDMLFVVQYLERCKSIAYVKKALYQYRVNPLSAMHNSSVTRELNWKKISAIKAAEQIQILLKNQCHYIRDCCSFRVAKSSLWFFIQLIICKREDNETVQMIARNIKDNYKGYKRVACWGKLHHIAMWMTMRFPKVTWRLGVFTYRAFPKMFETKFIH